MAGRPANASKVNTGVKSNPVVKVETTKETNVDAISVNLDLQKTNEELQNKLDNLAKIIEGLQSTQSLSENKTSEVSQTIEEVESIDMNKRITITSITMGGVNLKTSTDGTAKQFRLEKLGQTIPIFYAELISCMNTDRWIFEEGLVYINDPLVVKSEYLEERYKNFLDINKINNIMNFDTETIKNMVSNTTSEIQETIVTIIANKINSGEYVDMNKVTVIEKSCKNEVDIREIANQIR